MSLSLPPRRGSERGKANGTAKSDRGATQRGRFWVGHLGRKALVPGARERGADNDPSGVREGQDRREGAER